MEQPYLIKSIKKFANTLLQKSNGNILDLCTGSGVIGQSVLPKKWTLKGIDINPRALDYSKFNLKMNKISGNYEKADATRHKFKEKYDKDGFLDDITFIPVSNIKEVLKLVFA